MVVVEPAVQCIPRLRFLWLAEPDKYTVLMVDLERNNELMQVRSKHVKSN